MHIDFPGCCSGYFISIPSLKIIYILVDDKNTHIWEARRLIICSEVRGSNERNYHHTSEHLYFFRHPSTILIAQYSAARSPSQVSITWRPKSLQRISEMSHRRMNPRMTRPIRRNRTKSVIRPSHILHLDPKTPKRPTTTLRNTTMSTMMPNH